MLRGRKNSFSGELYAFLPDSYLLSVIGAGSATNLRLMIMKMFHETRLGPSLRTIGLLLEYLDKSYASSAREREMNALERLLELRGESSETVQGFWLRFEAIMVTLENTSSILSSELVFMRAIKSLQLSHQQKTAVLMMLGCQGKSHDVENLKSVSIRLFGLYRDVVHGKTDSKTFVASEATDSADGEAASEIGEHDAFAIRKTKPGKRDKPGMETSAIRKTQAQLNMENNTMYTQKNTKSPSKIICYRCGKSDHVLKQCPLPFQQKLAFAPVRPPVKQSFVANSSSMDDEGTSFSLEDTSVPPGIVDSESSLPLFEQIHIATEEEEQDWVASWLEKSDQILSCDLDESDIFLSDMKTSSSLPAKMHFIVDSGASSSVCGMKWMLQMSSLFAFTLPKKFSPSKKTFRFGNLTKYNSSGSVILGGTIVGKGPGGKSATESLTVTMDVIELEVPLLMSKASLKSMNATLCFGPDEMLFGNSLRVPLLNTSGGHIFFDWRPHACTSTDSTLAKVEKVHVLDDTLRSSDPTSNSLNSGNQCGDSRNLHGQGSHLNASQIMKTHIHLGHAETSSLLRIFKLSGKTVSRDEVENSLAGCKCARIGNYPQNPTASKYLPEAPGQSIFLDIFYHETSNAFPALLIVCSFTKFACARFVSSLKPIMLIGVLLNRWPCLFGMPSSIMCDRGTHFQGPEWSAFCDTYSIRLIMAPTASHYQVGTVERQVELVKRTYRKLSETVDSRFPRQEKLAIVCASKNITPSSTSLWTPLFLVTGRSDHVTGLLNACPPDVSSTEESYAREMWERLQLINELRGTLLKLDAKLIVDFTQRKRLRCPHQATLKHNDSVVVWLPGSKRWNSGFRFLFDSGKNIILERGSRLVKSPSHWVKPFIAEQKSVEVIEPSAAPSDSLHRHLAVPNPVETSDVTTQALNNGSMDSDPSACSSTKTVVAPQSSTNSAVSLRRRFPLVNPLPWKRYHLRSSNHTYLCDSSTISDMMSFLNGELKISAFVCDSSKPTGISENPAVPGVCTSKLFGEFGSFDIGRIPPRIFLRISEARMAIRDEIRGLAKEDRDGIPIALVISANSPEARRLEKIHTAMVCKVKPHKGFKARLCLRGGQQSIAHTAFVSAPTASRDFMRWLIIFLVGDVNRKLGLVDISKAFTQSDYLHPDERLFAWLPSYIGVNSEKWAGDVAVDHKVSSFEDENLTRIDSHAFDSTSQRFGLVLYRPLYGSRDAPYRWWMKISQVLRQFGFIQLHCDCCLFAKYRSVSVAESLSFPPNTTKYLDCIIMLHVDDLLYVGNAQGCSVVESSLAQFDHSGFSYLDVDAPLTFCGIEISRLKDASVELSQQHFYEHIVAPPVEEFLKNDVFAKPIDTIRRSLKSFVGACIWLYQTRFDIIYEVSRLASSVPDALSGPKELISFTLAAGKLLSYILSDHISLKYFPWEIAGLRPPQLFVFSDASFATLRWSGSTESICVIYGRPVKRNGPVECHGNILLFGARRIARVCRSSAHSEGIAVANAADTTLYLQCVLSEILYGFNQFQFLREAAQPPLISPFKPTPSIASVRKSLPARTLFSTSLNEPTCMIGPSPLASSCTFFCSGCHVHATFSVDEVQKMYNFESISSTGPRVHALLMSDCSNAISSLLQGNPRNDENAFALRTRI